MAGVIFQCSSCRTLSSATSAAREADRAGLACDACGAVTWLSFAGSPVAASSPWALPPVVAPVVDVEAPRPAALVVAQSQAVAAHFSDEQLANIEARILRLPEGTDVEQPLAASFAKLLNQWGNDAEHKRFLKAASVSGSLAFAGQRYRQVLDVVPNEARAKNAQNEILTFAMAAMSRKDSGTSMETDTGKNKQVMFAIGALVIVTLAVLAFALPKIMSSGGKLFDMSRTIE